MKYTIQCIYEREKNTRMMEMEREWGITNSTMLSSIKVYELSLVHSS